MVTLKTLIHRLREQLINSILVDRISHTESLNHHVQRNKQHPVLISMVTLKTLIHRLREQLINRSSHKTSARIPFRVKFFQV